MQPPVPSAAPLAEAFRNVAVGAVEAAAVEIISFFPLLQGLSGEFSALATPALQLPARFG
jgi:hypothetical protein